ncbi:FAD-dependent oxidoreductase [Hoeflea sp.]|uniref:FAD-dependent oxidoreductase n=1 Tax=Hoeflea sp. TaxID=1940281 RepID=UPI003B5182F7
MENHTRMTRRQKLIVVGAGAGGLSAAITAAAAGIDVTLVERATTAGRQDANRVSGRQAGGCRANGADHALGIRASVCNRRSDARQPHPAPARRSSGTARLERWLAPRPVCRTSKRAQGRLRPFQTGRMQKGTAGSRRKVRRCLRR